MTSNVEQRRTHFQALCASLRPDLVRFALWLSHDRNLAEDVVQESLLRAWKASATLLDRDSAKPWLLTIVRREYARCFERKRVPMLDVHCLVANEEPELACAEQPGIAELRGAVEQLPDEYREPLVLQVQMGYSVSEISLQLDLSESAVLTRLFRARIQLRELCGTAGE